MLEIVQVIAELLEFLLLWRNDTGFYDDDACTACAGRTLESIGVGAFRCMDCGHECGPGLAAWREAQQRRAQRRTPPAT